MVKTKTVKPVKENGCPTHFRAVSVLPKKDSGGLYVMREIIVKNGEIVSWKDNEIDLVGVQMGKAIIAMESNGWMVS